jgi:hypothetical protein
MSIPSRARLARYYAELQKIEDHRSLTAERNIQKLYKEMLTNLQGFLGTEYAKYSEDDVLTYAILARKGEYARFLEEVQSKVNGIVPSVNKEITKTVKEVYRLAYEGMVNAVANSVNDADLAKRLSGIHLTNAKVIKAAVKNPVDKLTLNNVLEKNRKQIVYNIKSTITNGLMNGDRMSTMARKIQDDVEQNYRKAMLIARTEVHRVRETGHDDSSNSIDDVLKSEDYDYRMVKIWRSKQDSATRRTSKANHVNMHMQTVLQDEEFDLGNGVTAPCPGKSGKAYHDCNCRCRVSRKLMSDDEFFQATGRHFKNVEKPKKEKKQEKPALETKETEKQQISFDNFPTTFKQKTAKKQTQKFVDYVNSIDGADSDMIKIYDSIGKIENIERNGVPFKVSYTKSGHSVGYGYRRSNGALTEVKVKIPKLDGDDITGAAQTTAHEMGHYIDLLMRSDADKYNDWISTRHGMGAAIDKSRRGISDEISELFKRTNEQIKEIRKEVKDRYAATIATYKAENADVVSNMFSDYTSYKKYQKGLKKLYDECEDVIDYEVRNKIGGVNSLQDIYDALSKGSYRNNGVVTYGHGARYYSKEENQIHEIWANYCALSLTRPDLIEMLKADKPELVAVLETIKAEILKRIGEL